MSKLKHVDIISTEPLASESKLLARITLNGGPKLEFRGAQGVDQGRIWTYLKTVVPDVDPDKDPNGFLHALPGAIDATYIGATGVHDAKHCPYHDGDL
jgi:hypothetical protein